MSEEVDQITKVPSELEAEVPKKKEKDPKKVAAGKVAAYSKKMKKKLMIEKRKLKPKLKIEHPLLEDYLCKILL